MKINTITKLRALRAILDDAAGDLTVTGALAKLWRTAHV